MALVFCITPLAILRPYLIQYIVDTIILSPKPELLLRYILAVVGVMSLEALCNYSFTQVTNLLGQSIIYDLRTRVFNHLIKLKLRYFDTVPIGQSVTRTINDVETINTVFSEGLITITADCFTITAVLAVMLYTSWQLTVVSLLTLPFLVWAGYWFKEGVKEATQIVRTQVAAMNTFLQEHISGMRIVQIFHAETKEMQAFERINGDYRKANIDTIFHYALFFPMVEILSAVSVGLMIWWGAGKVLEGTASLGILIAFPLYLNMLFRPIRMLADKFNTLQMGLIAAERVFLLLDDTEFKEQNEGKICPENLKKAIEFKNVHFEYIENKPVLHGVSFKLQPNETLAIVGSTGSGKTTIINLLGRFYPLKNGQILIGDHDLETLELTALRSKIGMVLQDVFLFAGSVHENITLRDPHITKQQVVAAAKTIGAHEFISELPDGYDYQVRERGAMLSAGQRQLISFVRALVYNPDILILDEATASIDPATEHVIQYAIQHLIQQRTSIVIAHRLSTIRHANQIMVLEKGEVKELGSHQELAQIDGGFYRTLLESWFLCVN